MSAWREVGDGATVWVNSTCVWGTNKTTEEHEVQKGGTIRSPLPCNRTQFVPTDVTQVGTYSCNQVFVDNDRGVLRTLRALEHSQLIVVTGDMYYVDSCKVGDITCIFTAIRVSLGVLQPLLDRALLIAIPDDHEVINEFDDMEKGYRSTIALTRMQIFHDLFVSTAGCLPTNTVCRKTFNGTNIVLFNSRQWLSRVGNQSFVPFVACRSTVLFDSLTPGSWQGGPVFSLTRDAQVSNYYLPGTDPPPVYKALARHRENCPSIPRVQVISGDIHRMLYKPDYPKISSSSKPAFDLSVVSGISKASTVVGHRYGLKETVGNMFFAFHWSSELLSEGRNWATIQLGTTPKVRLMDDGTGVHLVADTFGALAAYSFFACVCGATLYGLYSCVRSGLWYADQSPHEHRTGGKIQSQLSSSSLELTDNK